jgi:hypothetical protein
VVKSKKTHSNKSSKGVSTNKETGQWQKTKNGTSNRHNPSSKYISVRRRC